jgi:hypothetical protein
LPILARTAPPLTINPNISQETPAEMIGTTRSRVDQLQRKDRSGYRVAARQAGNPGQRMISCRVFRRSEAQPGSLAIVIPRSARRTGGFRNSRFHFVHEQTNLLESHRSKDGLNSLVVELLVVIIGQGSPIRFAEADELSVTGQGLRTTG